MKKQLLVLTILLIMALIVGCFFEEKTQLPIIGKTIEEALDKSNRNVRTILHKEELKNGVLVFYMPDFKGHSEAKSQLGLEYLEATDKGWELNYKGGMYSSGIEELVYFEFFPDDSDVTSPLPLFYGEIKSSEIEEILVIDLNSGIQNSANIINIDKKPDVEDDMRIWYITIEQTQNSNFMIKGIGNKENVLFSKMQNNGNITQPADLSTVAVINGEIITLEDIDREIKEREIAQRMGEELAEKINQDVIDPQDLEGYFGKEYLDQNEGALRHIERYKRAAMPLDYNKAFNLLVRNVILYLEAKEQGYYYSLEEVSQMIKQLEDQTIASFQVGGQDPNIYLNLENEVLKKFGYESRVEWYEMRLPYTAKAMATNQLRMRFFEKINEIDGPNEFYIYENLWEDYTEFLIRKANIQILAENLELIFYGEQWQGEKLTLKAD